ncbi:MAG: hypothetical protein H7Y15_03050, partial [Pseudonocardia sp.]|nr:hypothetical protein [Pseudonocardia sp.]
GAYGAFVPPPRAAYPERPPRDADIPVFDFQPDEYDRPEAPRRRSPALFVTAGAILAAVGVVGAALLLPAQQPEATSQQNPATSVPGLPVQSDAPASPTPAPESAEPTEAEVADPETADPETPDQTLPPVLPPIVPPEPTLPPVTTTDTPPPTTTTPPVTTTPPPPTTTTTTVAPPPPPPAPGG